jgi:hypothetical protein
VESEIQPGIKRRVGAEAAREALYLAQTLERHSQNQTYFRFGGDGKIKTASLAEARPDLVIKFKQRVEASHAPVITF